MRHPLYQLKQNERFECFSEEVKQENYWEKKHQDFCRKEIRKFMRHMNSKSLSVVYSLCLLFQPPKKPK